MKKILIIGLLSLVTANAFATTVTIQGCQPAIPAGLAPTAPLPAGYTYVPGSSVGTVVNATLMGYTGWCNGGPIKCNKFSCKYIKSGTNLEFVVTKKIGPNPNGYDCQMDGSTNPPQFNCTLY